MAAISLGKVTIVPKGAWSDFTAYERLDVVTANGSSYLAKQMVPAGTALTNTAYWQLLAEVGDEYTILIQENQPTQAQNKLWIPTNENQTITIPLDSEVVKDVKIDNISIVSNGMANVPMASANTLGVVKPNSTRGISMNSDGALQIYAASVGNIKTGSGDYSPIVPSRQNASTFYGLAKAAGDSTQSASSNSVGTYTDEAKSAIQHMLGTDINLAPYESDTTADATYAVGEMFMLNGKLHHATMAIAIGDTLTVGTNCAVVNASEVFAHDVQVNGASVLSNGVANVPIAGGGANGVFGVIRIGNGLSINAENGLLMTNPATAAQIKAGTASTIPLSPYRQHDSVFYGLAKAAGADMASSSNAVGTYTDAAKSAISQMLNAPESVSGATPSITAKAGIRYVCGEVSTLTITTPATGAFDILFESGSTATVLTITPPTGLTMMWPAWFDPLNLEANTIYELNILDGIYAAVMSWPTA